MGFIDKIYDELGENDANQDVSGWLSTGFIPLDFATSAKWVGGGLPMGRISEISGLPSTGKTLLATKVMVETQRRGGFAVFLDHEHSFSLRYAKRLGLTDMRGMWAYRQPETAEQSFEAVTNLCNLAVKEGFDKPITIVIDSVASMVTKEELAAQFEPNMRTRLSLAACMSASLKLLAPEVSKANVTLILLNQVRVNPNISYGDNKTTAGGNAPKFYASVRIMLSKGNKVKDKDGGTETIVGEEVTAKVIKNKVAPPFRTAEYVTDFEIGINLERSHIDALEKRGLLGSTKGFVEFKDKKWRKSALVEHMRANPEEYESMLELFKGLDVMDTAIGE